MKRRCREEEELSGRKSILNRRTGSFKKSVFDATKNRDEFEYKLDGTAYRQFEKYYPQEEYRRAGADETRDVRPVSLELNRVKTEKLKLK